MYTPIFHKRIPQHSQVEKSIIFFAKKWSLGFCSSVLEKDASGRQTDGREGKAWKGGRARKTICFTSSHHLQLNSRTPPRPMTPRLPTQTLCQSRDFLPQFGAKNKALQNWVVKYPKSFLSISFSVSRYSQYIQVCYASMWGPAVPPWRTSSTRRWTPPPLSRASCASMSTWRTSAVTDPSLPMESGPSETLGPFRIRMEIYEINSRSPPGIPVLVVTLPPLPALCPLHLTTFLLSFPPPNLPFA